MTIERATRSVHPRRETPATTTDDFPVGALAATAIGDVISRDGTSIGYRRFGHGPGIVILHGTASSGHNHRQLAEALSDAFTVYVPDRRGRGLSGPFGDGYGLEKEIEDLDALLSATGARDVFGVSSGGIICLQAALTLPSIRKAAIFEPPLFADRAVPTGILARFDREMAHGNIAAALVTAMKGAQMGPSAFRAMPRWITERLTGMMLTQEARKGSGDYVPMRTLAPTLHYDFQLVVEASGQEDAFAAIKAGVLLLGGSKSPGYLKVALGVLGKNLPGAERIELPGLDHAASWNSDRGGRPGPVAAAIRRFLA